MKSCDAEDHTMFLIKLKHQNRNKDLSSTHNSILKGESLWVPDTSSYWLAALVHRYQLGLVCQVLQRWVPPVDEGVGTVVELQQLNQ